MFCTVFDDIVFVLYRICVSTVSDVFDVVDIVAVVQVTCCYPMTEPENHPSTRKHVQASIDPRGQRASGLLQPLRS